MFYPTFMSRIVVKERVRIRFKPFPCDFTCAYVMHLSLSSPRGEGSGTGWGF